MSKKDFFIVLFRMFGIYSVLISLVKSLPTYLSFFSLDLGAEGVLFIFLSLATFIVPLLLLVYKAPAIVQFLKLDKGFDDDYIQIGSMDKISIVKLGLIIVSGIVFVDNVIVLIPNIYQLFKETLGRSYDGSVYDSFRGYIHLGSEIVGVLIGYIILTNYSRIAAWIVKTEE